MIPKLHPRDDDVPEVLESLPESDGDWMFGYGKTPNAFVYIQDDKLCILPIDGGWLGVETDSLLGDIAPFAD